ncbi:MAG: redox-sensing transcriptional repressor Rex [Verrucomicrobiales bacterium]|nr:redox-sensing transcriptional repressor Rex [Verrucomicrobiales bacterium]
MEKIDIPRRTVYRLSLYQRCLQKLMADGVDTVSSEDLANEAGVKSTQLRKDLGYVGQIGTRGLGYGVATLSEAISGIMGTSSVLQPVVLVGIGNLGAALLRYSGFRREGFEIIAAFDSDTEHVKSTTEEMGVPVLHSDGLSEYVKKHDVKMAIIAVPESAGQQVADALVAADVTALLNFSPARLTVPEGVFVNQVDLAAEMSSLAFFAS